MAEAWNAEYHGKISYNRGPRLRGDQEMKKKALQNMISKPAPA